METVAGCFINATAHNRPGPVIKEERMTDTIREIDGYQTSNDYALLYELAKTTSIICLVKYSDYNDTYTITDIAHTIKFGSVTEILARGVGYVYANDRDDKKAKESFIKQCENQKVEFLVPDK